MSSGATCRLNLDAVHLSRLGSPVFGQADRRQGERLLEVGLTKDGKRRHLLEWHGLDG
jgi:hypothetical protein